MPTLKVHLSIGYPTADHNDEIEVDQDDYDACETDEDRDKMLSEICQEWANDYIETWYEIV